MRLIGRKNFFLIATFGLFSLVFALAWLGNVPFVNAQVPTHVFKGKVSLDGRPAPDGTPLRIFVGGQRIGAADTKAAGGRYVFRVAQPQGQRSPSKTVTFAMQTPEGRRWFPQTVEWQPGGETTIDLRVPLPVGVGPDLRPAPPRINVHVFKGKVNVDGRPSRL